MATELVRLFHYARHPQKGHIEQTIVTFKKGKASSAKWSGTVYRSPTEAARDVARLNAEVLREHPGGVQIEGA